MNVLRSLVPVWLLACFLSSCSLSGIRTIYFEDEHAKPVHQVLVVPLSSYRSLGVQKNVVRVPYLCDSGDNLIREHLQPKGAIVAPGFFVGSDKAVADWLFLKRGYDPKLVGNNAIESMTGANMIAREARPEERAVPVDGSTFETVIRLEALELKTAPARKYEDAVRALLDSKTDPRAARELLDGNYQISEKVRRTLRELQQ